MDSPVAAFQRRMMLSAPPVSSVRLSGRNAADQTGSPGPTSVRAKPRVLRLITATDPPMLAAATSAPSGEIAIEITGLGPAATSPARAPPGDRKYTLPSAPPVAISPSPPTATALSGTGIATTRGDAESASGQMRAL